MLTRNCERNQIEFLDLKIQNSGTESRILKMKISLEELTSDFSRQKKESGKNKHEVHLGVEKVKNNVQNLRDTIKCTYIHIVGVSRGEKRKGQKKIFEEIMTENFPNWMKYMHIHDQKAQ